MNPLTYLKDVIASDKSPRISALLALIAGLALSLGFLTLTVAAFLGKEIKTEFVSVSAALVSLSTFAKDGEKKPKSEDSNDDEKKT